MIISRALLDYLEEQDLRLTSATKYKDDVVLNVRFVGFEEQNINVIQCSKSWFIIKDSKAYPLTLTNVQQLFGGNSQSN